MEKFPEHFLDITSPEERMTTYAAEVLKKFSPFWSDDQFDQMEQRIVSNRSPNMLEIARERFKQKRILALLGRPAGDAFVRDGSSQKQKQSTASCAAAPERAGLWRCMV